MSAAMLPARPGNPFQPTGLLQTLLTMSPTAVAVLQPRYADDGATFLDFTLAYLNPAGQYLLGQPEYPAISLRALLAEQQEEPAGGGFAQVCQAFQTGEPTRYEAAYQTHGQAERLLALAQCHDDVLVVNLIPPNNPPLAALAEGPRQHLAHAQQRQPALETYGQQHLQLSGQLELLSQILGQVPAAIATLREPNHHFTFFNAQYQHLAGQRAVLGRPLAEVLPEAAHQGFVALLDQVYLTGQPYLGVETHVQLTSPAGPPTEYYVNFAYQPLHDEQGRVSGILIFAVDVTTQVLARRQSETLQAALLAATQAQVQERELLYQVFANTPAAICLQRGPEHRYEYVNAAYERFFPGREFLGRGVAEVVPESVGAGVVALLDQVYQTGETYYGYELPVLLDQPDGSQQWTYFTFTYQALREHGEVVGISTFAYSVTEQVQARHEREAQQRLLAGVFEQAPAGVWVVRGPDFVFEFVNPAMARILGRTPEQALGRPYFEVVPELASQGLPELLRQAWEQGEPVFVEELPARLIYHPPGELGYFTFVFQPLRDEHGQVNRVACVAQDVTAQVLARQQVQQLNQELTAANEELAQTNQQLTRTNVDLDTFVYTASHDLKAPITNLEGLLSALLEQLPAAVQAEPLTAQVLDMMDGAVERFRTTIDQLTDLSRLQQAYDQPAERVALAPVVEDVRLDLLPLLTSTNAHLEVSVGPELAVHFPPKSLRSVVANLLSNALKYHHPGRPPVVLLRAARQARQVVLTVTDNGLGLSELQQRQLFGLFQRLHTHVEGTGVGLYMIKRLLENSGGTIAVESQVEQGSIFTVTLPV